MNCYIAVDKKSKLDVYALAWRYVHYITVK